MDLLVEHGGKFVAIEAKFTEVPDAAIMKGMDALQNFYGDHCLMKGYIACRTQRSFPLADRIHAASGSFIDQFLE